MFAALRRQYQVQVPGAPAWRLGIERARAAACPAPMSLRPSRLLQPGPLRRPAKLACLLPQLLALAWRQLQQLLAVPSRTRLLPQCQLEAFLLMQPSW